MKLSHEQKDWSLIIITIILAGIAIFSIRYYISALFCGALAAYLLFKPYSILSTKLKSHMFAAIVLSVASAVILLGLLSIMIPSIINQSQTIHNLAQEYIPILAEKCQGTWCDLSSVSDVISKENIIESVKESSAQFAKTAKVVITSIGTFALFFVIFLLSIFYFLEYGPLLFASAIQMLPFKKEHSGRIIAQFKDAINAVVVGNIGAAVLQGIIGGILFAAFSIPSALFFGIIMAVTAFIPGIGPGIIWIPASILLFAFGYPIKAIALFVLCAIIMGYIDNILKPKIIGDKLKLSSFVIFVSILGGLATFGLLGIFIGPILFTITATCIKIYQEQHSQ